MKVGRLSLLAVVALGTFLAVRAPIRGQDPADPVRLVAFRAEPTTPEFGAVFSLMVTLRAAPATMVFMPDTLIPAEASSSAGVGSWSVTEGPADSIDVAATYPVMGFLNGEVELPELEVWTGSGVGSGDGAVRSVSALRVSEGVNLEDVPGLRSSVLRIGRIGILPHQEMAAASDSLVPRPPADVLGGVWSPWLIASVFLTVLLAGGLGWTAYARWSETRSAGAGGLLTGRSPRAEALYELDRILSSGWHREGRLVEFYEATTGVLRRLSEQEKPHWGTALTSSELLERIRRRWGPGPVEDLGVAIPVAEMVKFGGHRPAVDAAEAHWAAVRDWIQRMPED